MKTLPKSNYREIPFYKDVLEADWNDWQWQFRNVIRDVATLKKIIEISPEGEKELALCLQSFRMALTPYYASMIDSNYERDVIRLQAVPLLPETQRDTDDQEDPQIGRAHV